MVRNKFSEKPDPKPVIYDACMTVQDTKMENDINIIMDKARDGRHIGISEKRVSYGDFSSNMSLQECFDVVEKAKTEFSELPADVRKRFGHNPALLLEFLNNEDNREEAMELGLIEKPEPEYIQKVRIIEADKPIEKPSGGD